MVNNKINQPFLDNEIRDEMTEVNSLLTLAIETGSPDIWRQHNHRRNILYKSIYAAKTSIYPED